MYKRTNNDIYEEATSKIERKKLEEIIQTSYNSIIVTDKNGVVILANKATARLLETTPDELIGKNVKELVEQGYYNRSVALEATVKKEKVTGLLKNRNGCELMSTSTPVFDGNGEIIMVVTNTTDKDMVDQFLGAIEKEKQKTNKYKTAVNYLRETDSEFKYPVSNNTKMKNIIETCKIVSKSDSTVLLYGDSGVGKEVITKFIHKNSLRREEPLIPVNCSAIPQELLESEFFGYVKGAFTGASSQGKIGIFEIADKGTLFLDEIGELPLAMQAKLLRVLESGEFQRLGSTEKVTTDVRVITATNRNLKEMVLEKKFRSDLYYRINVIPIYIPPLRERKEDIPELAQLFLNEFNKKYGTSKMLSEKTLEYFRKYSWPGNIRELRNIIERLSITTKGDIINYNGFIEMNENVSREENGELKLDSNKTLKEVMQSVEEAFINQIIEECDGNISKAAEKLGMHRTMLHRKLKNINTVEY